VIARLGWKAAPKVPVLQPVAQIRYIRLGQSTPEMARAARVRCDGRERFQAGEELARAALSVMFGLLTDVSPATTALSIPRDRGSRSTANQRVDASDSAVAAWLLILRPIGWQALDGRFEGSALRGR
jgi:hypothetical protein